MGMFIESCGDFDLTGAQFSGQAREAGFAETRLMPLAGPASAAIGDRPR